MFDLFIYIQQMFADPRLPPYTLTVVPVTVLMGVDSNREIISKYFKSAFTWKENF